MFFVILLDDLFNKYTQRPFGKASYLFPKFLFSFSSEHHDIIKSLPVHLGFPTKGHNELPFHIGCPARKARSEKESQKKRSQLVTKLEAQVCGQNGICWMLVGENNTIWPPINQKLTHIVFIMKMSRFRISHSSLPIPSMFLRDAPYF